jgi:hypothetical protein
MAFAMKRSLVRCFLVLCIGLMPISYGGAAGAPGAVRIESVREVDQADVAGVRVKEYVLQVEGKDQGAPVRITFGGPSRAVQDEIKRTAIVGDHVLVTTERVIGVFDRKTGREEKYIDAAPAVSSSQDASLVAYQVLQPRFTPPEAETSIINALDVRSLESQVVFPERDLISKGQSGTLVVWQDDPARRHVVVSDLFWSPSGKRLVFFCKHSAGPTPGVGIVEDYVVVVDLSHGVAASRFVHQLLSPDLYRKPGTEKGSKVSFEVAAVTWLDEQTVELKPVQRDAGWKDRIVLKLPSGG